MDRFQIIQGRRIGPAELDFIRKLLAQNPPFSRYGLSRVLCQSWDWRDPKGQLKDMAARALLLKLERRGLVELPLKRCVSPNRMRHNVVAPVDLPTDPIIDGLPQLAPLSVRDLSQSPADLPQFEWLLHRYHYLSYASPVGLNLKYLVLDRRGRPLSCLLFGSAAWQCSARDRFIGWNVALRQARLQEITNNTRLLILPWVQVPHLASHVLSQVLRRLRQDWERKYARALHLVETFVDPSRFRGACYQAANWIQVGQTTGRTRQNKTMIPSAPPKAVWLYPLTPDFRSRLSV